MCGLCSFSVLLGLPRRWLESCFWWILSFRIWINCQNTLIWTLYKETTICRAFIRVFRLGGGNTMWAKNIFKALDALKVKWCSVSLYQPGEWSTWAVPVCSGQYALGITGLFLGLVHPGMTTKYYAQSIALSSHYWISTYTVILRLLENTRPRVLLNGGGIPPIIQVSAIWTYYPIFPHNSNFPPHSK